MKKAVFLLVIVLYSINIYSQIAYYDAINIRNNISISPNGDIAPNKMAALYLALYFDIDTSLDINLIVEKLGKELPENPFLNSIKFEGTPQGTPKLVTNIASSIGGLDVTTFSQGLSQFMIERAKAELNVAFFERFRKFTEENDEIQYLFPVTSQRMAGLVAYHYTEMLTQLRNAFYEDLNNLPDNILVFLQEGDDFEDLRKTNPDFIIAINTLKLIRQIEYLSPTEFINQLPQITLGASEAAKNNDTLLRKVENFETTLNLVAIYSNSLRDTSKTRNWITSNDFFENVAKESVTRKIYNGLIFQQIKNAKLVFNGDTLCKTIANNKEDYQWFGNRVDGFIFLANKVDFTMQSIKDKKFENSHMYTYINTLLDMGNFGNQFVEKYYGYDTYKKFNNYLSITKDANDIYRYVYLKEYSSAVLSTVELLNSIYAGTEKKLDNRFFKYGTFMANMVDAQSPEEISNVIEAAVLPVGSSSIKKHSGFNVSVNGYLGGFGKFGSVDKTQNAWSSNISVSAPIGIAVSHGFNKGGSVSLTGTLIDVGAIVDYQLANDSSYIESTITWGNLFSPGVFLVYGMACDLPISVGIGGQYGPGLSSINGVDNITINKPDWRFGIVIAVDIPLFTVYNKPKIKK